MLLDFDPREADGSVRPNPAATLSSSAPREGLPRGARPVVRRRRPPGARPASALDRRARGRPSGGGAELEQDDVGLEVDREKIPQDGLEPVLEPGGLEILAELLQG